MFLNLRSGRCKCIVQQPLLVAETPGEELMCSETNLMVFERDTVFHYLVFCRDIKRIFSECPNCRLISQCQVFSEHTRFPKCFLWLHLDLAVPGPQLRRFLSIFDVISTEAFGMFDGISCVNNVEQRRHMDS